MTQTLYSCSHPRSIPAQTPRLPEANFLDGYPSVSCVLRNLWLVSNLTRRRRTRRTFCCFPMRVRQHPKSREIDAPFFCSLGIPLYTDAFSFVIPRFVCHCNLHSEHRRAPRSLPRPLHHLLQECLSHRSLEDEATRRAATHCSERPCLLTVLHRHLVPASPQRRQGRQGRSNKGPPVEGKAEV